MKRKTLIIMASAYLILIAVIILIALLTQGTQSFAKISNNETEEGENSNYNLSGTDQSIKTDHVSGNSYPDQQTNESADLGAEQTNTNNEKSTETLETAEDIPGANTQTLVSMTAVFTNRTSTPSSSSSAYPINAQTRTPTPRNSTSSTPSPTITPTPQTGWGGDWTVYFQQSDGTYTSGEINIDITGTNLIGSGMINSTNYSFEGRIISGGQSAIGRWTNSSDSGDFDWTLISDNQFAGSRDINFGLCGTRPGWTPPDPCYIPPLS